MSYVTNSQVQAWLNRYKYLLEGNAFDPQFETTASDWVRTTFSRRYDTSTWVDSASTPSLVEDMIAMLVASYTLRVAISEDDGMANYADWLEKRVYDLTELIMTGALEVPGLTVDPLAAENLVPAFFPTDESTALWQSDPTAVGGTARAFTMEQIF